MTPHRPQLSVVRLEKSLDKQLLAYLGPLGYRKDITGGAIQFGDGVVNYIAALTQRVGPENRVTPFCKLGLERVDRIYQRFMWPEFPYQPQAGCVTIQYGHFVGTVGAYRICQTEADLPATAEWLIQVVEDSFLPCLHRLRDPYTLLDEYVRHDEANRHSTGVISWSGYSSALTVLILAKLYEPHRYNSLKARYTRLFEPLLPEIKNKAQNLLSFLECEDVGKSANA